MFGGNKMYKKGVADVMDAYKSFEGKQEDTLNKIASDFRSSNEELDSKLKSLGKDIIAVYDYMDDKEKRALYNLCTPMDLKDLEDAEKRLLLAVLYQLAEDDIIRYNDRQRKFINYIRKYLEIVNIQTFADYSAIEKIDSIEVQKTFMRVCLEFMYLQDDDEMSDNQKKFFDIFSVNERQAELIEFEVIKQFHLFGEEGMVDKYSIKETLPFSQDTINNEIKNKEEVDVIYDDNSVKPRFETYVGIPLKIAERIIQKNDNRIFTEIKTCLFIETKNYIIFLECTGFSSSLGKTSENRFSKFNKKSETTSIFCSLSSNFDMDSRTEKVGVSAWKIKKAFSVVGYFLTVYSENIIYYFEEKGLYMIDILADTKTKVLDINIQDDFESICYDNNIIAVSTSKKTYVIDLKLKVISSIKDVLGKNVVVESRNIAVVSDVVMFCTRNGEELTADDGGNLYDCICSYNVRNNALMRVVEFKDFSKSIYSIDDIFNLQGEIYIITNKWREFLLYKLCYDGQNYNVKEIIDHSGWCDYKVYHNYLVYYNRHSYSIYVYDFERQASQKVVENCYSYVDDGVFKVKLRKSSSNDFKMIGQWIYFLRGNYNYSLKKIEDDTYRVNVNTPLKEVKIDR